MVRAVRVGQIDYSNWHGTLRDYLRERLILDDLEREMTVKTLNRLITATKKPDIEIADKCNQIELPWIFGEEQAVIDDLEKFYEENKD